jgi:hypothetical protein
MRLVLAALVITASSSISLAQSWTSTTGTTQPAPTTTAPASNARIGEPKVKIPPAARSGEKGLRYGDGAADAGPVQVRRNK